MNSIFITGVATCGKDTCYSILQDILKDYVQIERRAFADNLKIILAPFIKEHFNISSFTKDPKEKELIRGIFVEFGLVKRKISNGTFWWKLLEPDIKKSIEENRLPCITDLRYCVYERDEHFFAKQQMDGVIIHITRFNKDGSKVLPPNLHEKENDPKLETLADYKLSWTTSDNKQYLEDLVKKQLSPLLDRIKNKYGFKG